VQRPQWLISVLTLAVTLIVALVYAADTPTELTLILRPASLQPGTDPGQGQYPLCPGHYQ